MMLRFQLFCISALLFCVVPAVRALNNAVPAINGHLSRSILGDGTGVIIGIIDSGVDDLHPALRGFDSLNNPRMVAEANFVSTEPGNTGDDVFGHGTWVASAALGRDAAFTGMATDARYVNARVLTSTNGFASDFQVKEGMGFAIDQGANVLNLSLNFFSPNSSGNSQMDLMVDWAAYNRGVSCAVCVGNISTGQNGIPNVRGPGSAYNGVTVGRTTTDFNRVHLDSGTAFTADGRMKPDLVAPGTGLTLANDDWEGPASDWDFGLGGCSFATPLVAGLMAQQIEAGNTRGLSTSPLVIKATMMNSASKVPDKQNNPWQPTLAHSIGSVLSITQPLDDHGGAGQIDGLRLAEQYLAGNLAPGSVGAIGWNLNTISTGRFVDYEIDTRLISGSTLTATLTWFRHVGRMDDGDGFVDGNDFFFLERTLSNLDLQVFRNGLLIAESVSALDNVEHLHLEVDRNAQYTLRVLGANVTSISEEFALAWYGTAVPEPGGIALALLAAGLLGGKTLRWPQTRRNR